MFKKTINIKHFLRFNVRPLHCRQRTITSGIWDRGTYKMSFFFFKTSKNLSGDLTFSIFNFRDLFLSHCIV